MIGVSTYKTNFTEELLQILIASEGEINDFEGKTYLEYAEKAGVLEEVEKWWYAIILVNYHFPLVIMIFMCYVILQNKQYWN